MLKQWLLLFGAKKIWCWKMDMCSFEPGTNNTQLFGRIKKKKRKKPRGSKNSKRWLINNNFSKVVTEIISLSVVLCKAFEENNIELMNYYSFSRGLSSNDCFPFLILEAIIIFLNVNLGFIYVICQAIGFRSTVLQVYHALAYSKV